MQFFYKLSIYVIVPLVIILLACLRIPAVIEVLASKPWIGNLAYGFLIILTIISYYLNFLSPYKKLEKLKQKVWKALDQTADSHLSAILKKYDFSLSIMVPRKCYFFRVEPHKDDRNKAKFSTSGKIFKVLWEYPQNKNIDRQLKLTVNQGICGIVFRTNNPRAVDLTQNQIKLDCFTLKQERILRDYKIIACVPIIKVKPGVGQQSSEVIGILNMHSKDPNSINLINSPEKADELLEKLFKISIFYKELT